MATIDRVKSSNSKGNLANMGHDVFISYASNDKATADAVCATLEASHIRCWIAPRDGFPGKDYGDDIISAIKVSKLMVVVFSARCNLSEHVKDEVERAVSKGIFIVPFRIDNAMPEGSLELHLSRRHWLDALTPPLENHLKELCKFVTRVLMEGPPEPLWQGPIRTKLSWIRRHPLWAAISVFVTLVILVATALIMRPENDLTKEFRLLRLYVDQLEPEKAKALWESIQQRYHQNDIGNELNRQENRTLAEQLKISEPKELKKDERQ